MVRRGMCGKQIKIKIKQRRTGPKLLKAWRVLGGFRIHVQLHAVLGVRLLVQRIIRRWRRSSAKQKIRRARVRVGAAPLCFIQLLRTLRGKAELVERGARAIGVRGIAPRAGAL